MSTMEPARLIPVFGIKGDQEAEERAVSALLAVMTVVRSFSAAVLAHTGATRAATARVEAFTDPTFKLGDRTVRPDGLIEVHVGKRTAFRSLVEVKTGLAKLDADQINTYLDVARAGGFDCVVTISNEIAPSPGVHPTAGLHVRSNSKVTVHHLSWALVLAEAVKEHAHRGVDDPEQAWILSELIRYLTHPKSGVLEFSDMGDNWAKVRDATTNGTLNRSDTTATEICQRWDQLLRVAALRLGTETGADVQEVIPKAHRINPKLRGKEFLHILCTDGILSGVLRVPAAAGDMTVTADIRASIVEVSATLTAPQDGTPRAAVVWLTKQLSDAPGGLVVDTYARNARSALSETLERLREDPLLALDGDRLKHPARFCVRQQSPMGEGRRTRRKPGFIDSVLTAVTNFYGGILQDVAPYTPKVPHISRPSPITSLPDSEGASANDNPPSGLEPRPTVEVDRGDHRPPNAEGVIAEVDEDHAQTAVTDRADPSTETGLLPSVERLTLEERRAHADRSEFPLDPEARRQWEAMNAAPARDLPDLRGFMQYRSPYIDYGEPATEPSGQSEDGGAAPAPSSAPDAKGPQDGKPPPAADTDSRVADASSAVHGAGDTEEGQRC